MVGGVEEEGCEMGTGEGRECRGAAAQRDEEASASLVIPWLGRRGLLQRERAAQRDVKRFAATAKSC